MRVSWNAVRLAALAAAATASGYLWRAALEPSQVPAIIRVAPPAAAPAIAVAPAHHPQSSDRVVPARARPQAVRPGSRRTRFLASRPVAPASHTHAPPPTHVAPKPAPKPPPPPKPPATPPTQPAPSPAPAPAPASPPVAAPPPAPAAPPPKESDETTADTKPGWGHGDKNHDHSGPHNGNHG